MYAVKEIYYTIQGEGFHSGRAAVFCRFSGCNLWSGLESDRMKAVCRFCDTEFNGTDGKNGGKYTASELLEQCMTLWKDTKVRPFIVFTGGEPALQLNDELIKTFHNRSCLIAIETNGTLPLPAGLDWICVSPKAGTKLLVTNGNELKLVYPQENTLPESFINLNFEHFYLQPMDGVNLESNTIKTIAYCLNNPFWKISVQTHKFLGIP